MAYITRHRVTVGPTATGAATGYTDVLVNGFILAIRYTKPGTGGLTNGHFDITGETSGVVIWDQDDVNATVTVYPRAATCDTLGVASLYAAGGEPVEALIPVAQERISVAVSAAGNGESGIFDIYVGG